MSIKILLTSDNEIVRVLDQFGNKIDDWDIEYITEQEEKEFLDEEDFSWLEDDDEESLYEDSDLWSMQSSKFCEPDWQ